MRGAFLIASLIALLIVGMLSIKRQSSVKASAKIKSQRTGQPLEPTAAELTKEIEAVNKAANAAAEKALQHTDD